MKKHLSRGISLILSVILFVTACVGSFDASAAIDKNQLINDINSLKQEAAQIQNKINDLKKDKNNQGAVLSAIRQKISNIHAQINRCNQEIENINSKIAANKAEIEKTNVKIEDTKLLYKKRLRAIQMSSSESPVKILLGAESFSQFLQLAQLTASVTAQDNKIVEQLKEAIDELNAKNKENEALIEEQIASKEIIASQQAELAAQEKEAASLYNSIAANQKSEESNKKRVEDDIRAMQNTLNNINAGLNFSGNFINPNTGLMWPTPGRGITSGYGPRWGGTHHGIDIAYGGCAGHAVRAIADGYVSTKASHYYNSCTHNYGKSSSCYNSSGKQCGGGYGNFCVINHGDMRIQGYTANYAAWYAHVSTVIVRPGQYVSQGQIIGYIGTTGWSTGYHLHLGITRNGGWIDPENVL